MLWYWIVFLSLMILAFFEQFSNLGIKNAKKICLIYNIFFIFAGTIRWNQTIGDWQGYYGVFNWEEITSLNQVFTISYWPFEPIYYIVMRMINYLTGSYTVVLFFMTSLTTACFYKTTVYLNEKNIILSYDNIVEARKSTMIATYLAYWATNCASIFAVRTNMAGGICLLSLKYIEERKIWKFLAMIVIASMFHFAAIVFIIAYPVYYKKVSFKRIMQMIVIACVVGVVGWQRIIPLIGILGGRYAEKVSTYNMNRAGENFAYQTYSTVFLTIRAILNTVLILMICFYIGKYMKGDRRYNGLLNVYMVGAFIQALTVGYNLEFARIAVFFLSLQYFVLPYIFKISRKDGNRMIYFIAFVALMAVKMFFLLGSSPDYANFTTIFNM